MSQLIKLRMDEIWKPIPGYEATYQASSLGNFRSNARPLEYMGNRTRIWPAGPVNPWNGNNGYLKISLCRGGKKLTFQAHRLIALTFHPNPNGLPFVNHIDGDKHNNVAPNLEWCDRSSNMLHAYRTGLISNQPIGEAHHWAVLTVDTVLKAKALIRGGMPVSDAARALGVSPGTLYSMHKGRSWRHIQLPPDL